MRKTAWIWFVGCAAWTVDGVANLRLHALPHAQLAFMVAMVFLAAGLFWAEFSRTDFAARAYFFLACVLIAGVYGSLTANRRILYIQALPAAAALAAVWLS